MGKKSAPAPPDYAAAAERTAESDRDALAWQTAANRPDLQTPWGNQTWDSQLMWDPATAQYIPQYRSEISLSPSEQAKFDAQQGVGISRSLQALGLVGRMQDEFGEPMNWDNLPDWGDRAETRDLQTSVGSDPTQMRARAEDAIYSKGANRLEDRFGRQEDDMRAQMVAQGLRPGDAAYDRAMTEFQEGQTDAYDVLQNSAIMGGGQEMQRDFGIEMGQGQFANQAQKDMFGQDITGGGYNNTLRQAQLAEQMQQRGFSLNEINALLHGQQVGMPAMPSFSQAGRSQGADYSGAANDQFNSEMDAFSADQALTQGILSGMSGMGSAAITGGMA